MIRHALEHLELDEILDAVVGAQCQSVADVEEVVTGDADVHRAGVLRPAGVREHPFVVRVHLDLGRVRRLRPAGQRGLDALHREVRALDDAELDRRAPAVRTRARPGGQRPLRAGGVRKVRLQHDTRAERQEFGLVEDLLEGGHRRRQIAILLHVEVDELRRSATRMVAEEMAERLAIERAQAVLHQLDRVTERNQVDLAQNRGDLDRDVFDVIAGEERQVRREATRCLTLAEDRLAELVQVQPDTGAAALLEIAPEVGFLARNDHGATLVAKPRDDRRHHDAREVVRHHAAHGERRPLPPLHVVGDAVAGEKPAQLVGDARRTVAPKGLIDERERQRPAGRVFHEARDLLCVRALGRRLSGVGRAQQRLGDGNRGRDEILVVPPLRRRVRFHGGFMLRPRPVWTSDTIEHRCGESPR